MMTMQDNAIVRASRIINALENEKNHEFIAPFYTNQGPEKPVFAMNLGLYSIFSPWRYIFGNPWLFTPIIDAAMRKNPVAASTVRTTVGFTLLNSGIKENVQPPNAVINANLRIHPNDNEFELFQRFEKIISDQNFHFYDQISMVARDGFSIWDKNQLKERVEEQRNNKNKIYDRSKLCNFDPKNDLSFKLINQQSKNIYGSDNYIIHPVLCPGGTDSRHFIEYSEQTLRLNFLEIFETSEIQGIHGKNERVKIESLERGLKFYYGFLSEIVN